MVVKAILREKLIDVAIGKDAPTIIIKEGKLVNVHTAEIYSTDIAIKGDRIAYIGNSKELKITNQTRIIDATGKYIVPGLIDPHIHIYHAQLNIKQLAKALLLRGTTTIAEGFYAIGIVSGIKGIKFCLEEIKKTPLKIIFLAPALAYYQNQDLGLPKTPNGLTFKDMKKIISWPECRGIEEVPYTPILEKHPDLLGLLEEALARGKIITGHASGLSKGWLAAYIALGASNDHECTNEVEALERARLGMRVIMRQGSAATDVAQVIKALTEHKISPRFFSFCADVASTLKIAEIGHIDDCIRVAVSRGLEPIITIQAATLNAAEILAVEDEIGSIAPGKIADIVILEDLPSFKISMVIANGELVVKDSKFLIQLEDSMYPEFMYNTVNLPKVVEPRDFAIIAPKGKKEVTVRVIGVREGTIITEDRRESIEVHENVLKPDLHRDILKIVMVDRFRLSGDIGKGFVQGFKLKSGAIGTTYSPISENIIVVGTNDLDICHAVNKLAEIGGGHIVINENRVIAQLELPICGLLSDKSFETVVERQRQLKEIVRNMGCDFIDPFHTLGFTGIVPEIGTIRISEKGLIDVSTRKFVPLIVE